MWHEVFAEVIQKTLSGFGERLAAFGPNLLAMILILAVGLLVSGALRVALRWLLPRIGFDGFAERIGLATVLQRGGVSRRPSGVVALTAAWAVLGLSVLLAIGALDLPIAMDLLLRTFTYLPQVLIAIAILVLGSLVSALLRRTVLIAAVNAGLPSARFLAGAVHSGLLTLFAAMALEHLGVGRQILIVSFGILFGGVVLALALAFGLAGRDMARDLLEHLLRGRRDGGGDDLRHL
jgi:hypothetical protein